MISFISDNRLTCCPALWTLSGHFYHKGSVWVRNYRKWQHHRGMQELVWTMCVMHCRRYIFPTKMI